AARIGRYDVEMNAPVGLQQGGYFANNRKVPQPVTDCDAVKPRVSLSGVLWPVKRCVNAMKNDMHLVERSETLKDRKLFRRHDGNSIEALEDLLGNECAKEVSRLMVRCNDYWAQRWRQQSG